MASPVHAHVTLLCVYHHSSSLGCTCIVLVMGIGYTIMKGSSFSDLAFAHAETETGFQ